MAGLLAGDMRLLFPVRDLGNPGMLRQTVQSRVQLQASSVVFTTTGVLTLTSPQPAPCGAPEVVQGPARCGGFAPPPCDAVPQSTCHPGQAAACLPSASASPTQPTLFGLPKLMIIIRMIMRSHSGVVERQSPPPRAQKQCDGAELATVVG
jgi:hypothetical protein